tara:strand:- start:48 stop:497 length:450 start_codon:yes stop_codon:yes gene_type:complete
MKSFKNYIKEASGFPTGPVGENPNNLGGSVEVNPSEVGNPAVLKRLNAIVGGIADHEYLVAEHAIERLRGSLNKIGLSFGTTPTMEGSSGSFSMPLSLFGGRFGKDGDTPYDEFLDDDGISHIIEGGLSLNISYEMIKNNSCKVYAKVE